MITFDLHILIYRPVRQVFQFVATPENDFQWQYGTLACARVSEDEMGIGTLFRSIGHFMGRRMETIYEVTHFDLPRAYGFRAVSGLLDSHTLYTFEMIGRGTQVNISAEASPADLFEMRPAVVEKKLKKQSKEDLAMLKSLLEAERIPVV